MSLEQANQSAHGHEIMRLIASRESRGYSRAQLAADVVAQFGTDARFHACAGDNMTLDELLVFLADRGKVIETTEGLRTDLGLMCSHDEGEH
jgi:probable metal-binding protein